MSGASKVWRRILGTQVKSFTDPSKTYTLVWEGDKLTCDCPDFRFRGGSYLIVWEEEGEEKRQKGCKHIADYFRRNHRLKGVSKR